MLKTKPDEKVLSLVKQQIKALYVKEKTSVINIHILKPITITQQKSGYPRS